MEPLKHLNETFWVRNIDPGYDGCLYYDGEDVKTTSCADNHRFVCEEDIKQLSIAIRRDFS